MNLIGLNTKQRLFLKLKEDALTFPGMNNVNGASGLPFNWLFDVRNIVLRPHTLGEIGELFWEHFTNIDECQVGGMETASIAIIAAIVLEGSKRGKRVTGFYIRKSRKKTGLLKQIEGALTNAPVILVDDLINTGSSFIKQIALLEREELKVYSIFTLIRFRANDSYQTIIDKGISIHSLFTLKDFSLPYPQQDKNQQNVVFKRTGYFHSNQPDLSTVQQKSIPITFKDTLIWATDSGHVWGLDQETFKVRWHRKLGIFSPQHVFNSPLIFRETIICTTSNGLLYMIDANNGSIKHRVSIGLVTSTPLALPNSSTILLCLREGSIGELVALDLLSMTIVWRYRTKAWLVSEPLLKNNGDFVVIDTKGYWYSGNSKGVHLVKPGVLETTTGKPAYIVESDQLVWTTSKGDLYISPTAKPRPKKIFTADFGIKGALVVDGDLILVPSLDSNLYAINISDGTLKWKFETYGRIFSTPVVFNSIVYIGSNNACLYAIDRTTGKALGNFQVTERITAPVIIESENSLLVATYANELYRFSIIHNNYK